MKRLITVMLILACMAGCSTLSVLTSDNATQAEKQAALCDDAQLGVALADVMLGEGQTGAAAEYWQAYRSGAVLALKMYCVGE